MTNIKEVAKIAGVSVTTVSRVINNRGYIGKNTRRKVEQAMNALDYHPNQIARALQKSQSFFLGVIVPDSNHPFFSDLIQSIECYANDRNYKILLCNSLENPEKEANYINMLRQNRVDGIVMCSHTLDVKEYMKVNFPIVSFDRIISASIPCIGGDNFKGGELATEHLVSLGCKQLLHICGPLSVDMLANRRTDAFTLTCMKHKLPYRIIEGAPNKLTFDYFYEFIRSELTPGQLAEFDGVFCTNDLMAYALYTYATEHGIDVPNRLKIVGYDYHSFTRMLQHPKITTVRQPTDRLGKMLCSTVIQMIEGTNQDLINNVIVDVDLVRGTTT